MSRKGFKKTEWWQRFFKGTWRDVQLSFWDTKRNKEEADFIEDVLSLGSSAQILDVPCGDGRLTIELALRGYRMSGIDLSDYVLNKAMNKAKKNNLDITWHRCDMRRIPWKSKFDGAICMWGSFGYFNERGNLAFIKRVSRSLKPKGIFLLDAHIAETLLPIYQPKGWTKVGNITVLEDRYYDYEKSIIEVDWTFIKKGRKKTYRSSIRIYTYKELLDLLKQCGFRKFEAYGSIARDRFAIGSRRLHLVAKK